MDSRLAHVYPAIMLSRIKMGFPDIRKALLNLDDQALSIEDLKAISKQLPTPDEVSYLVPFLTNNVVMTPGTRLAVLRISTTLEN
jgi:hypothetical protein